MPIDVHAHYVPPQLIDAIVGRGEEIGVRLVRSGAAPPAVHFNYGFKVRPFFPRLIEPVEQRHAWLDEQGIDCQIVGARWFIKPLSECWIVVRPWTRCRRT